MMPFEANHLPHLQTYAIHDHHHRAVASAGWRRIERLDQGLNLVGGKQLRGQLRTLVDRWLPAPILRQSYGGVLPTAPVFLQIFVHVALVHSVGNAASEQVRTIRLAAATGESASTR